MPEETKTTETADAGFADAAKHNAEVAAKLSAQDISGHSMAPADISDVGGALDALAKTAEDAAKKEPVEVVPEKPVVPAKSDEEVAKEKADADAAAAEREVAQKRADELFKDSPGLPTGASPKSSESFAAIKIKAAQEIAKAEAELEKLRKENADLSEKTKNAVPPETLKELEEHRQWRAKLDAEADPKFKEFDKTVSSTQEFIYAQLKKSPVITDEVIAEIKKHGGPENIQMTKIFDAIKDPSMQRLIESKLADIEMAKFNKSKAIEATKANITEYMSEREKAATQRASGHDSATEAHFNELTGKLEWYKEKQAGAKATDAEKKAVEAHNAFVADTRKNLAVALKDNSPEMRAIMLAGMAQLFHIQNVHTGTVSRLTALEKELAETTAKYDKLRNGSTTRLRESVELPGGKAPVAKASDQFTKTAAESLDDLRKQVTEERERAAAAGGK